MKYIFSIFIILFFSCKKDITENAILIADREAPIGWNYIRLYNDSTFEFEHRSFLKSRYHIGSFKLNKDTLIFIYDGITPPFGKKAIIDQKSLIYTNGETKERLIIWLDSISEK